MTPVEVIVAVLVAAVSGGMVTNLLTRFLPSRKDKLNEAEIVQRIYSQISEDLEEQNQKQEQTISRLRTALISLTDVLNEVFPKINGITADEKRRLRAASVEARLTGLAA